MTVSSLLTGSAGVQGLVLTAPVLDTMNWLLWVLCHLAALLTFLIPGVRAVAAIPLNHVSRKEAVVRSPPTACTELQRLCGASSSELLA